MPLWSGADQEHGPETVKASVMRTRRNHSVRSFGWPAGARGEALIEVLEPESQFIRQLDSLGEGLAGSHAPSARRSSSRGSAGAAAQAFHHGFVAPLARDPAPVILHPGQRRRTAEGPTRVQAAPSTSREKRDICP